MIDDTLRNFMDEARQLIANARENATEAEALLIDRIERRGMTMVTQDEWNRLQEIADR